MSQVNQAKQVKVVILGDSGVGKSSIMLRFVTGNFQTEREPTLGGAFMPKLVHHGSASIKYQIWDTAGQEKYHSLASMYYRDAQVAILVYDITKKESYESLKKWVAELRESGPKELMIAVVGNKTDLKDQEKVKEEEAKGFSKEIRGLFMLTSAKEDKGVKELFDQIGEDLLKKDAENEQKNRIKLEDPVKKPQKGCCA